MNRRKAISRKPNRTNSDEDFFKKISSFKKEYDNVAAVVTETPRRCSLAVNSQDRRQSLLVQKHPSAETRNLERLYAQVLTSLLSTLKAEDQSESNSFLGYLKQIFHIDDESHTRMVDAVNMKEPTLVLNLQVVRAKNLPGMDANGLSDPFCELSISSNCKEKQYTSTEEATLNPVWNEYFCFPIENAQKDSIRIEVWDYDPVETFAEKLMRLGEVSSVKGFGNCLKEIAAAAAGSKKQTNSFIGSVNIHIKSIPPEGFEKWFDLASLHMQRKRGEIYLKMAVGAHKAKHVAMKEYRHVMYLILAHEIEKHDDEDDDQWDGKFSSQAEFVLNHLKSHWGLVSVDILLAQWRVYTRVQNLRPLDAKLFLPILNATLHRIREDDKKSHEVEMFWQSCKALTENFSTFICESYICFFTNPGADTQVQYMMRTLLLLKTYLSKETKQVKILASNVGPKMIANQIMKGISSGAEIMFHDFEIEAEEGATGTDRAVLIGQLLIADLQKRLEFLDKDLAELIDTPPYEIVYRTYDKKYGEILQPLVKELCARLEAWASNKDRNSTEDITQGSSLLEFYLAVKNFADFSKNLKARDDLIVQGSFHAWFHASVVYWLEITLLEAAKRIRRAVNLDDFVSMNHGVLEAKITSSSVDANVVFHQILKFWDQLAWSDPKESYIFVLKIVDDLCKLVSLYSKEMAQRVGKIGGSGDEVYQISDATCFAINNIKNVAEGVVLISEELEKQVIENSAEHFQQTLREVLSSANANAARESNRIMGNVVLQMEPVISRYLEEDLETNREKVGRRLYDYLDDNLDKLEKNLPSHIAKEFLCLIWIAISKYLKNLAEMSEQKRRSPAYFEQMDRMVQILSDMLFSDGTIEVNSQECANEDLQEAQRIISLHKKTTSELILEYTRERFLQQEDIKMTDAPDGTITIRAAYYEDKGQLQIEILHGLNMKAYDINGLSDPYVKLRIIPPEICPPVKNKTKVQEKTLTPLFDEIFTVDLTKDQMSTKGFLRLGIKDYDFLKKNDFMGEIHIPLSKPSNDQGMLTLLQTLEGRCSDEKAMKFVRKERAKQY